MRPTMTSSQGVRHLSDFWVNRCSWKTIMVTAPTSFSQSFPMALMLNSGLAERATSIIFTWDLPESFSIKKSFWSAYGALEDLRLTCVNMARLRQNFSAKAEGYEKVEQTLPVEQLAPLQASICLMERDAMLQAALTIVRFYQELAHSLAQAHGIPYPADLARVMCDRLEQLCNEVRRGPS